MIHGLQQIIDRVHFERLDCVLVVRGHENDVRGRLRVEQATRHLEPRETGHLHVEKDDVGLQTVDRRERLDPVARLADHFDAAHPAEQIAQLVARQLFIIDEDRAQVHVRPAPARPARARESPPSRRCPVRGRSRASVGGAR